MSQKVFISFGGGPPGGIDAVKRIVRQATNINLFDKLIGYTDKDLKEDPEFWPKHGKFIVKNRRGYGYWLWKPYLIKKTMEQLKDGDVLLYCDAGCEINYKNTGVKNKLRDYLNNQIQKEIIIGYPLGCKDGDWTKGDLLDHFNVRKNKAVINTGTRQGGVNMFHVNKKTRNLVNIWYETACNYRLLDDSPSKSPNLPGFKQNRHDQAIFSILTKLHRLYSKKFTLRGVIITARNKSGKSRLKL